MSKPDDASEREADRVADLVTRRDTTGSAVPGEPAIPERESGQPASGWSVLALTHRAPPGIYRQDRPAQAAPQAATPGGSPYATILPGYSQEGDTCGAASLVSALLIWDREHWDPAQPNSRLVAACNLILVKMARGGGRAAVDRWSQHPTPEVRRLCGTDDTCVRDAFEAVRTQLTTDLERIRDSAQRAGAAVPEQDYQRLGLALYFLWRSGGQAGLSSSDIWNLQRTLGLATTASGNVQSFDELFTNSIVTGLASDEFAQATWFTRTGQQHAFLIGRLQSGEWFLSDQGPRPAAEFRAPTIAALGAAVRLAAQSGQYWLFTGTTVEYLQRGGVLPGWTGVMRLGRHTSTPAEMANLVPPGTFLAEIDEGWSTTGNRVDSVAFVAQRNSLTDAQAVFTATGAGGLIVELPRGVFSVYTTTTVSDANVSQTTIDAEDSSGGLLVGRSVFHAWLLLATSGGRRGSWFRVF